ncbi:putative cytochrome P450 [Rosellinia necatrix]|uniref:Putative cytochrome P450 n=1 Tax=Rosellinia necatrix TaxID=77044 RepID=A0A1S7UI65_ROSNE|nr:putative cytochrome P450 [Rosellinia necatrix]
MAMGALQKQAKYGEMTTLSMGTKTWVLLNHERVLNEIIAKRASITHERPYFPVASGLVSKDHRLFLQQTEQWREGRRLLHRLMTGEGSKFYSTFAESASLGLLRAYLDEPDAWYAHNYRYPLAIMYRVVTGTTLQKTRGELEDLQKVTSAFLTCINSSLVDFFPRVGVLPRCLQLWRRRWEAMGEFHYDVFRRWWSGMKGADIPESSFFREVMLGEYTGSEDQAMYITLFIITAGSDNPRMTMNAFLMVCIAQPEFIQRMRLELDNVCGADADRLPNLDDLVRAPYSSAVVKEVLRWRPTVPLIPQRVLAQDLEFEGYRFPRGTEFLVNAVSVSTCGFDEADKFKPERWLGDGKDEHQGDTMPDVSVRQDLWQFAFSAGRRSCVGYKLAQKELFIAFSRLVYCFDFSPAGAFDDKELNAFAPGEPFPVKATIRSPAHELLIRKETARCDVWGV